MLSIDGPQTMDRKMTSPSFADELIMFTAQVDGRLVVVENVPARVCVETGEQLFSPATVERIQELLWGGHEPARTIETPVFNFAA